MKPLAVGTLGATPLAHALVYARNKGLTGRLELADGDQSATIVLAGGAITSVETRPVSLCPGAYFGAVAYELGYIGTETLDSSLLELAKTRRLHGDILVEQARITTAQREQALVEQIHRKVHHLFTLPESTTYAFYDAAPSASAATVAVDPLGPAWRGIRDHAPETFVRETLRRVGSHTLRAVAAPLPNLPPDETELLAALADRPMTVEEMKASTKLSPTRVELLVYLLVISKCAVSVTGARTHPSVGPLPAATASGIMARVGPSSPPVRTAVAGDADASDATSPARLGREGIAARAAKVNQESYFEVLGVSKDADVDAVRAAYMRLARTWHPDKLAPELHLVRAEAAKIFAAMVDAYRTLSDPQRRRAYLETKRDAKPIARSEVLRSAEHAIEHRQFDLAAILCSELCEKNRDDGDALALHTWAKLRGGEATEEELRVALVKLLRAVNTDTGSAVAHYYRGLVHKRLGNTAAAARDFARVVALDPGHVGVAREIRLMNMRATKGSGEHQIVASLVEKLDRARKK
jgi:hypothetical protein